MISFDPVDSEAHLAPAVLAGYVSGTLSPGARSQAEAHLADCDACRIEVVAVARLLVEPRRSARWRLLIPLAAAAGIAGLLVLVPFRRKAPDDQPVVRGPDSTDARAVVTVVAPGQGATIPKGAALIWHQVSNASDFRVTVSDEKGDSVWVASTTDTAVTLPADSTLQPNRTYFWYVDALLSDGMSLTSGAHEFRSGP